MTYFQFSLLSTLFENSCKDNTKQFVFIFCICAEIVCNSRKVMFVQKTSMKKGRQLIEMLKCCTTTLKIVHPIHFISLKLQPLVCARQLFLVECVFSPLVLFNMYDSILNPISSCYLKFRTNTKLMNVLHMPCLPQILLCITFLLLHPNYHKLDGLRQSTVIISQFRWVRSPTTSQLGPLLSVLQGCNQLPANRIFIYRTDSERILDSFSLWAEFFSFWLYN